jgi:quercetin dioxygenase-like cupin family protein
MPAIARRARTTSRARVALLPLLGVLLAATGCTPAGSVPVSPAPSIGIVRTDLGTTLPADAPGQRLGLWHYTIPAGAALVPHRHPGWQVARIVSGNLRYSIISGTVTVIRAGGTQESRGAGETTTLGAGDTVIENPGAHHFGANDGPAVVELYTATLLTDGQPVAIPIPTAAPSGSP